MSEQATAPVADAPISVREAATLISAPPEKPIEPAEAPVEAAEPEESPPQEGDAGPAEEQATSETADDDTAQEEPPIVPPVSWSKEHKDAFKALPRHLQQMVAESERAREADFHQKARETAERAKALQAREQQAEQARQHYEQALPSLLAQVNTEYQREFGNPTWAEIEEWSRTDEPKYVRWHAAYSRAQAIAGELQAVTQQQQQQQIQAMQAYAQAEDQKLRGKLPELFDAATGKPLRSEEAISYLGDQGYTRDELLTHYNQFAPMFLHDHRLQAIIYDAMRFRAAEAAAKKTAPKPVPQVQRPGSAPPTKTEAKEARLKDLGSQLNRTHSVKDAAKLISARG